VARLSAGGHLARRLDLAILHGALPSRPAVLDALLIDASLAASTVEALRRWAGGRVAVRLGDEDPEDAWLSELVRTAAEPLLVGELRVDLRRGVLERGSALVTLTDTEALLLAWLATQAGTVVSRGDLLKHVWSYNPNMHTRVVDVTIARLRTKIEADPANPQILLTVRGKGYRLDGVQRPPPADERAALPDSGLVGREEDWAQLHKWFERRDSLLTVLGPPGVGKTALASAFCATISGSVWCSLQAAITEDEGLSIIAAALGLPASMPEAQIRQALVLGERSLLVLDNVEHLLGLIRRLLDVAPASPLLLTSRIRLGTLGERCLDLGPLSCVAARALFLARARRLRTDFDADAATLQQLSELTEGLPLAVELAAAQVRVLSGADLVRVLSRREVSAPGRSGHKSYDEALASSWALLDPDAQRLLAILAVVRGDAPLTLVEALVDEPIEALSALRDASLVQIDHAAGGAAVHLLETVRRYVSRVAPLDAPERSELVRGVARHVCRLDVQARSADGWAAVRELGRVRMAVWGAVDLALATGDRELAATLGLGLTHCYEALGPTARDLSMLRKLAPDEHSPQAIRVAQLQALLLAMIGEVDEARRHADRCSQLARSGADEAEAVYAQTMVATRAGELDTTALEAVLDTFSDPIARCRALAAIGLARKRATEASEAIQWLERALAIADRLGIDWLQTGLLGLLASAHAGRGEWDRASRLATSVAQTFDSVGMRQNAEMPLAIRKLAYQGLGRLDLARSVELELIALMRSQGRIRTLARLYDSLSQLSLDLGDPQEAREASQECARLYRAVDDADGVLGAMVDEAAAILALGEVDKAREAVEPHLDSTLPGVPDRALEVAVVASLTLGEVDRAEAAIARTRASDPLVALMRALVAARVGEPVDPPPTPNGARPHLNALAALLGGPVSEGRTPRAQAMSAAGDLDATFPETKLVREMFERGLLPV
jgi:predicted ATPase/DNA-binding winged helix-turn-helix (wHTH) protein